MSYIKVIQEQDAQGELKTVYNDIINKRGILSEVLKCASLNPEFIVRHLDLYMTIMFGKSPLRRAQREMIAVVVSAANDCLYCRTHHSIALNHFWKDDEKCKLLAEDHNMVDIDEKDKLFCSYAYQLTVTPGKSNKDIVDSMKASGSSDREILDVTLVTCYFNMVNRLVLGLGVAYEEHEGAGYKYD